MAQPSISAVGLSKRYRSDAGTDGWLDALRDVSFDVGAGEAVGLIGRNGAGKSTLLRILSRVTRPTAGYADVYGRVGALLEVGTGFHPELSGRENTFLSGAMLGMSREEVRRRFDEIVAFSEIEAFIDTPVKRYSSGMYARLGFAVAAHLLPDILIVDEVLAVGDLPFQAKCLARMHNLAEGGTTVLFVSHNLVGVADLCPRGIVLTAGKIAFDGPSDGAIQHYRRSLGQTRGSDATTDPSLRITIDGAAPHEPVQVRPDSPMRVELAVEREVGATAVPVILNVVIERSDGTRVVHLRSDLSGVGLNLLPGATVLRTAIDALPLAPGTYALWLRVVGADPSAPFILDSDRLELVVGGDQRLEGVLAPRHRFEQVAPESSAVEIGAAR